MSKPLRVLIVEDSNVDAQLLLRELRRGGYEPVFERVDTPEAMNEALDRQAWDIVLADYVMPRFSGLAALELLKARGVDLPFIVVSGQIGEEIAVDAMKAGAHDYMIKGHLARLVPAVERELRDAAVRRQRRQAEEERDQLVGQLRDVNERLVVSSIRASEQVDEAERRGAELEAILGIIAEAVVVVDAEGRVVRMSAGAADVLRNTAIDPGRPFVEQLASRRIETEEGRPLPVEEIPLVRALGGETVRSVVLAVHPPPGTPAEARPVRVSVSAAPVRGPDGKLLGAITTFADASARHDQA